MKPSEVLKALKWVKGSNTTFEENKVSGVCALGAISCSHLVGIRKSEYVEGLRKLIPSHMTIPIWNDCYALDKEEVISKLEEVERTMGL